MLMHPHVHSAPAAPLPPPPPPPGKAGQYDKEALRKNWLLVRHYWHRIAGCSLSWFVWGEWSLHSRWVGGRAGVDRGCWQRTTGVMHGRMQ